jgi:hypothetical protein
VSGVRCAHRSALRPAAVVGSPGGVLLLPG